MIKSPDDIAQASKDAIVALTKAGTAFADGYNEISQHVIASTHKSIAANLSSGKDVLTAKTPSEWITLQSKWASDFVSAAVAQMTQLVNLSTKVANQTYEPIKKHFGAAESFTQAAVD